MEQNGLVNLLTPDSITGGSTTCFPRGGDPSDIDWALCTHSLYNAGAVRAGVLHEKIGISAHCPIFISVKTKLWLQLSDGDVTNCKKHNYEANHIKGGPKDKRVINYQKLISKFWKKNDCSKLTVTALEKAEIHYNIRAKGGAPELDYDDESEQSWKEACEAIQVAYDGMDGSFKAAINKMNNLYSVGSKKLTYFSWESVQIRRLRSKSRKFLLMWHRRKCQQNPFKNNSPRGSNKGNRSVGSGQNHRGDNPCIKELKKRLLNWMKQVAQTDLRVHQLVRKNWGMASRLSVYPSPKKYKWEIKQWELTCDVISEIEQILDNKLTARKRLKRMIDINSRFAEVKSKKTNRLKQIINKLSDKKPQTGALGRIQMQDGEIITDPKKMAQHLISFFKAWFGEGRKNRWNINPDGSSAHPLNDRDARGMQLVEALLVGNYYETATEGEELPEVVKQLYDQGLLSYKTNKHGKSLSKEEVESIRASFSPEEWFAARTSKVKKCTHPGADKITKPALFYCADEIFQELGSIVFLAEELGYIIKQHKVVQMWLIPKDAGFEKIERLRPLWF
jgi:hypothetical protein